MKSGDAFLAGGLLDRGIDAYLRGFDADRRDAYPAINAVTLIELREPPDPRRVEINPIVRYSVNRRIATRKLDYWDHATLLELAVLAKDEPRAMEALAAALAAIREVWDPETPARNLRLMREARERRGESLPWATQMDEALERRSKGSQGTT
jgi:hypothetical protein